MGLKAVTTLVAMMTALHGAPARAAEPAPFAELIEQARALRHDGELEQAVKRVDAALAQNRAPSALVLKGNTLAQLARPGDALRAFDEAAASAKPGSPYWRIALFGAARMRIWLGSYARAEHNYRQLLHSELNETDRAIAQAGLIKCLTLQNRPRQAYEQVVDPAASHPDRIHQELARAALWAGWHEDAWQHLQAIDSPPPPDNWRGAHFARLQRQVHRATRNPLDITYDFYDDSDQLQAHKIRLHGGRRFSPGLTLAADIGLERFAQEGRRLSARRVQVEAQGQLDRTMAYTARLGVGDYGDWTTPLWSAELSYRPNDQWGVQGFASREVVETFTGFDRHISFSLVGAAYDFRINGQWVAALIPYLQDFSDGNLRKALRARMTGTLSERHGLVLEMETRYFNNSKDDTAGYFNPDSFQDIRAVLRWRQRTKHGLFELAGGPGYQWIDPGEDNATMLIEARWQTPLADTLLLEARAGYSDAAADSSGGFSHRYGMIQLSRPW